MKESSLPNRELRASQQDLDNTIQSRIPLLHSKPLDHHKYEQAKFRCRCQPGSLLPSLPKSKRRKNDAMTIGV